MPKALENALIDAWEAAGEADWSTVAEQLGPFSVNTQTHVGGWTPLMVACGLPQVRVHVAHSRGCWDVLYCTLYRYAYSSYLLS